MKKIIITLLFHVSIVFVIFFNAGIVHAENKAETVGGKILFKTEDTGATSGIRWTTVGFTIRRNKTRGNPIQDNNYGTVWLKEEYKKNESLEGGKVKIVFTIPKADVDKALRKAGLEKIKENDKFYLNGIFQVKHNGALLSKKHFTFNSISNAESWANPNDFWDRFDVECVYHGGKEPVKVRYETKSGKLLEEFVLPESQWIPSGEEVAYILDLEKTYKGKKYKLSESYFMILSDAAGKKLLLYTMEKDPDFVVQERSEAQEIGGIKFVAVMVPLEPSPDDQMPDKIESALPDPVIEAIIRADNRGNEKFEVLDGIPTSEDLYVNVVGTDYLAAYEFVNKVGKQNVSARVSKTYELKWTQTTGEGASQTTENRSESKEVTRTIIVQLPYSYWEVKSLDYYTADHSVIENYALPGGSVTIPVTGYNFPEITYLHESDVSKHVFVPKIPDIYLVSETINGGSQRPSVPSENFADMAAGRIPDLEVKNDTVIFDGKVIMSGELMKKNGKTPLKIPESDKLLTEESMYLNGQTIEKTKQNGEFESGGSLVYRHVVSFNSRYIEPEDSSYKIPWVNPVVIHTPVVCDTKIEDKKANNQMIKPDKRYASLVLDLPFHLYFPTEGSHRDIKGYEERDYAAYTARRQVKFSFDVYKGTQYKEADTWINIMEEETEFFLPLWVDEGKYTIECRSIAINADVNNKIAYEEDLANLDYENYVAADMIQVEISGRIYGLNLFDISDYPIWESVFRKTNSLERSGLRYTVGIKDKNGEANGSKHTLTLVNGSHPVYKNIGAVKTGYVTRFALTTVGNMANEKDYIRIKPKFYYVANDASHKQEIDLYYSETFLGKNYQLVKAGSELDKKNVKSYRLGDPYLSIAEKELQDTAIVKNRSLHEIKNKVSPVFTFSNIMIPESMRTFFGNNSDIPGGIRPNSISYNKLTSSKQHWYCEYYLPSEVHIVKKDFDILSYAKRHGITYQEDFWLKDGYIIINFDIETIANGTPNLSYINSDNHQSGYCNMWKKEGYVYQKTDYDNHTFSFQDGDYIMYYSKENDKNTSAAQDYRSAGTH